MMVAIIVTEQQRSNSTLHMFALHGMIVVEIESNFMARERQRSNSTLHTFALHGIIVVEIESNFIQENSKEAIAHFIPLLYMVLFLLRLKVTSWVICQTNS